MPSAVTTTVDARSLFSDPSLTTIVARLEHLLKAQAALWRATLAAGKPDTLWGVPQVSEAEAEAITNLPPLGIRHSPSWPDEAKAHLRAALALSEGPASPAPGSLEERLGLEPVERDLALLALLPELDPRYRRLMGYLMDDLGQPWPSVELAHAVLAPIHPVTAVAGALVPTARLRRLDLVALVPPPFGPRAPLAQHGLKVSEGLRGWLLRGDALGQEPLVDAKRLTEKAPPLPSSYVKALKRAGRYLAKDPSALLILTGAGAEEPEPALHTVAASGCDGLLVLPSSTAGEPQEVAARLVAARVAGRLHQLVPVIPIALVVSLGPAAARLLAEPLGLVILQAPRLPPEENLPSPEQVPRLTIHLAAPDFDERTALWLRALKGLRLTKEVPPTLVAAGLAETFRFSRGQIGRAAALAPTRQGLSPRTQAIDGAILRDACRNLVAAKVPDLARHLPPDEGPGLEALVLPSALLHGGWRGQSVPDATAIRRPGPRPAWQS